MATRVYRPLKIIAFNASGIWRQRYELSKQLQDLRVDVALFSETHLKPHERFFLPNFVQNRTISAVKREQFVNDRMSYIILSGRWCDIIFLNVHAPTEDTIDDIVTWMDGTFLGNDLFYKVLKRVLGLGKKRLQDISTDNGVRVVNFVASKSTAFPHHDIHQFTSTSTDGKMHVQPYFHREETAFKYT
ncbi:hypothetical protein B7P43_G15752 [Cryptotermes secundus]|uniref:Endonuclease/exonuclease/phosphatase domain-containing protein n=1 Tax=Cryptotermes secundus TaxID=105785 RepID=A0A2J7QX23_9NEOP|nr:hypothetical protein B7P43_G15752 [Cryptotermes secundus]